MFVVVVTCGVLITVAFRIYDMDNDGFISNGELFQVLKMMVGNNLKDTQLQQIVDKTILFADKDEDGKISFEEFCAVSIPETHERARLNGREISAALQPIVVQWPVVLGSVVVAGGFVSALSVSACFFNRPSSL